MMEVRIKFFLLSKKLLRVLITDKSEVNLISPNVMEEIEQDDCNHAYCGYYNDEYCIEFSMGKYEDCAACKISSDSHGVILRRSWIKKKHAIYDLETCLLKLISCGQWYGLKTLPQ